MKTIPEIKAAIIAGQFSLTELNEVIEAVKYARGQLGRQVARELRIGSQVRFTGRGDKVYTGTVEAIKIKNATVATQAGRFRVPMSMLEAA